jgi:predicted transposase/invertase (TIGR01784 family)
MAIIKKSKPAVKTPEKKASTARKKETKVVNRGKYINPLTDFGFKRIFGTEANKDLLIDFLNNVLEIEGKIVSLEYKNVEKRGRIKTQRGAFFDLHCKTGNDEYIIIEMQRVHQLNFKDRVLRYVTYPIQEQPIEKDGEKYKLNPVYSVNVLNFSFSKITGDKTQYHHLVQLMDTKTKTVFYDKLAFVFIELPDFKKPENDLGTNYERWLYVLKHLTDLKQIPEKLKKSEVFKKLFKEAEIANMTPNELKQYDLSLKQYWDMYTTKDIVNEWKNVVADLKKENAAKDKTIADLQRQLNVFQVHSATGTARSRSKR